MEIAAETETQVHLDLLLHPIRRVLDSHEIAHLILVGEAHHRDRGNREIDLTQAGAVRLRLALREIDLTQAEAARLRLVHREIDPTQAEAARLHLVHREIDLTRAEAARLRRLHREIERQIRVLAKLQIDREIRDHRSSFPIELEPEIRSHRASFLIETESEIRSHQSLHRKTAA